MGWMDRLFGSKVGSEDAKVALDAETQAVIITLNGSTLPDEVYSEWDIDTLEEQLGVALGDIGECDGAEHGERESRVFLYGPSAEKMFAAVHPILLANPLAASAVVVIRNGPPGATQREVRLP